MLKSFNSVLSRPESLAAAEQTLQARDDLHASMKPGKLSGPDGEVKLGQVRVGKKGIDLAPDFGGVYIGRPSVLGNPYKLCPSESRGATLERYETYLRAECIRGGAVKTAILQLACRVAQGENLMLLCHCVPLRCHGDLLARAIVGYAHRIGEGALKQDYFHPQRS